LSGGSQLAVLVVLVSVFVVMFDCLIFVITILCFSKTG
jgi:hypothetical protein